MYVIGHTFNLNSLLPQPPSSCQQRIQILHIQIYKDLEVSVVLLVNVLKSIEQTESKKPCSIVTK